MENNGTIKFHDGKSFIIWENQEQEFGIDFVKRQMRQAIKRSRKGFYTDKIHSYIKELDRNGLFAVKPVKTKLSNLAIATDINKNMIKTILSWLDNIIMFKSINTGKAKHKNNYYENIERIFGQNSKE